MITPDIPCAGVDNHLVLLIFIAISRDLNRQQDMFKRHGVMLCGDGVNALLIAADRLPHISLNRSCHHVFCLGETVLQGNLRSLSLETRQIGAIVSDQRCLQIPRLQCIQRIQGNNRRRSNQHIPGSKTSATCPSLTKTARCPGRTVSLAPILISLLWRSKR